MKAEELRVGNYVNTSERSGWSYQICRQGIIRTINNGSCNITPFKCIGPIVTVKYDNIEPIPITEEWLLNLELKKWNSKNNELTYSNNKLIIHKRKDGYVVSRKWITIRFVHQLQNLYFAITGEELTIK